MVSAGGLGRQPERMGRMALQEFVWVTRTDESFSAKA